MSSKEAGMWNLLKNDEECRKLRDLLEDSAAARPGRGNALEDFPRRRIFSRRGKSSRALPLLPRRIGHGLQLG